MSYPPTRTRALAVVVVPLTLLCAAGPALAQEPTGSAARRATKFGQCLQTWPGKAWPATLDRTERTYGHLDAIRIFNVDPAAWTKDWWSYVLGGRSGVVNFELPPGDVLKGRYDAELRTFFRNAPTDRPTWWSYLHEPDIAHEQGRLPDLKQYRAAFAHVAKLARKAHNPQLRTTVVLFGYSGNPRSGQSIKDYWPGKHLTDVIAWDIYNGWATDQGVYGTTEQIAQDREAARAVGKPWAVAEFGSVRLRGDDGSRRAAWITRMSRYAADNGAQFATYFNTVGPGGADYRLNDAPSRRAWRDILDGSSV